MHSSTQKACIRGFAVFKESPLNSRWGMALGWGCWDGDGNKNH